ncbi:MAG: DUF5045 domain-containing protein [Dysgonamonadaceae bacterium]|jgi:hypothetical protein|nr:DUF5045 domain-containing protein [Dysgonamonadaceae bacterium]
MRRIIKLLIVIGIGSPLTVSGQTSYKQVHDKALELQIRSSVGVDENRHWKFHPEWYYNLFHKEYKSRENENNNIIQLDSIIAATMESFIKVRNARRNIEIIYEHELAHWNDRNNDWELDRLKLLIDDARESIKVLTGEFTSHNVPVGDAQKLYEELERINDKVKTISKAHLDNAKRRQGFETCLSEYNVLMNICYKVNNYSLVASKSPLLNISVTK